MKIKTKVSIEFSGPVFSPNANTNFPDSLYLDVMHQKERIDIFHSDNRAAFNRLINKMEEGPHIGEDFFFFHLERSFTMEYDMAEKLRLHDIVYWSCFNPINELGQIILDALDMSEYRFLLIGREWINTNELHLYFGCTDSDRVLDYINAAQGGRLE